MKVASNTVVSFDYTLKDEQGQVLDSSQGKEPLSFIHGSGRIIPGLEKALEGHDEGDSFDTSVEPTEAYGEYDENLIFDVPKNQFQDAEKISEGMQVQAQMQDGSTQVLTIKDIGEADVTLDANHPLAGQTLHFNITVTDVREPTQSEIVNGQTEQ